MTVELTNDEANEIAGLLDAFVRDARITYGNTNADEQQAEQYAETLRRRTGPPLDPILDWVEDNEDRITIPEGTDSEDVAREIQQTIAETGDAAEAIDRYHPGTDEQES